METIADLLQNEHILNFHEGIPKVPEWLGQNLRLMIGAGDLDHDDIPNIQKFSTYDVYFCLPWNNRGTSLRKNVEYLLANYPKQKLLCFLDYENTEHLTLFNTLFAGRFSFIDGHGGHCPHLDFCSLQMLLNNGGQALNIFEKSECIISVNEFEYWFVNDYFRGLLNINLLTSRIRGEGFDEVDTKRRLLIKLREFNKKTLNIQIDDEVLLNLDDLSLTEIQYIYRSLIFDKQLPLNLTGMISYVSRDWRSPCLELIIKKIEPDYKLAQIEAYVEKYGSSKESVRALFIIEKIVEDLLIGSTHSRNKYATLMKLLTNSCIIS